MDAFTHTLTCALIQLTATETMNYDDAFTLELVTEELLDKFNFVAGIVPILTTHITKVDIHYYYSRNFHNGEIFVQR